MPRVSYTRESTGNDVCGPAQVPGSTGRVLCRLETSNLRGPKIMIPPGQKDICFSRFLVPWAPKHLYTSKTPGGRSATLGQPGPTPSQVPYRGPQWRYTALQERYIALHGGAFWWTCVGPHRILIASPIDSAQRLD